MSKSSPRQNAAIESRNAAWGILNAHPILAPLMASASFNVDTHLRYVSPKGWLAVSPGGTIWLHGKRKAEVAAWTRIMAVALVCLGFGLVRRREPYELWELASILIADRFCDELKLGMLDSVGNLRR